ncbi:MAG: cyclophilin-like fold protein [Pseudoflavonifractor capillosus]|uniref:cyclophilin-like fold protein n=1 Tax=Pseudoflavonifractor capillosus TaxID=106588 RepID=UPI0023F9C298|nr:cyclophilin-like fold protein [Pseudoflavonifractor capillosus]MCI5929528.1 cyclophilin-like fold protein [Pseudoflavonifractor capillosus]MDY4661496.1 cyclophilin-like fold protein [Pseudoflavonifractor capillosus]
MARFVCMLLVVLSLTACNVREAPVVSPTFPAQTAAPVEETVSPQQSPEAGSSQEEAMLKITVGDYELLATFEDNTSAEEFKNLLAQGPVTVEMDDYGGFEKVGDLGTTLTRNDRQITTEPGDVILYQGNQITIYYGTNTWSFTRLARIDDPTDLKAKLGEGTVQITFSLA